MQQRVKKVIIKDHRSFWNF